MDNLNLRYSNSHFRWYRKVLLPCVCVCFFCVHVKNMTSSHALFNFENELKLVSSLYKSTRCSTSCTDGQLIAGKIWLLPSVSLHLMWWCCLSHDYWAALLSSFGCKWLPNAFDINMVKCSNNFLLNLDAYKVNWNSDIVAKCTSYSTWIGLQQN